MVTQITNFVSYEKLFVATWKRINGTIKAEHTGMDWLLNGFILLQQGVDIGCSLAQAFSSTCQRFPLR